MDHWDKIVERHVHFLPNRINTESYSSCLGDTSEIVGLLLSVLGVPTQVELVGQDSRCDGGSVVSVQSDQHHSEFGYTGVSFEDHGVGSGYC